jgi:hypothetical protein
MQNADTVLAVLRERGRRGLPCNELYRQLFNPQLYLTRFRLRHEALLSRMEVRDRPSLRRRSGGAKLEAAWSGDRRGGWEQPRQSRVGSVLPDGPGAVSETRRYTRGTGVVTPLHGSPALTRWMWAG